MCMACGDPAHVPADDGSRPQSAGTATVLAGDAIRFDDAAWRANYGALLYQSTNPDANPRWNAGSAPGMPVTLTYRFVDAHPSYDVLTTDAGFRALPENLRAIARDVMREVERIAGVTFVEDRTLPVEGVQLVIMGTRYGGGIAYFPGRNRESGDIAVGIGEPDGSSRTASGFDVTGDGQWAGFREVFAHELGHALGLQHPRDYTNGVPSATSAGYLVEIDPAMDTKAQTVLSYVTDAASGPLQWAHGYGPLDVLALQRLYGANRVASAGDDVYAPGAVNPGVRTIWDVGGTDTLDLSAMLDPASVDLRPAGVSSVGRIVVTTGWGGASAMPSAALNDLIIGPDTVIENVMGTPYADAITGNDSANRLDGGRGVDTLTGGLGDDVYVCDTSADVVVEADGQGSDTVMTDALVYELPLGVSVETLRALDPASTANQALRGNFGDQLIVGSAGANVINGYGGSDTLAGLAGDDTYLVGGLGDRVLEANGEGWDTVYTTVSYNLGANEVEVLSTVVQADAARIDLIGNYATQLVIGNYGNNILNGGVGGNDTLIGLRGDDTYAVGSQSISIVEHAGEGTDTLVTSVDYRIAAGVSIETFAAQARDVAVGLRMTGNEVSQVVAGTNSADVVDGRGGADTLFGFGGNDLFVLSTAPGTGNVDTLADFGNGADRIGLASDVFAAIGQRLDASEFILGTAAQTTDQHILYDQASGRLLWDADGSGTIAAVQIAQLAAGAALTFDQFTIIVPA